MKTLRRILLSSVVIILIVGVALWLRPLYFYDGFSYLKQISHGVRNHFVTVDGYRMHYEVVGPVNGPPIVLIHGLGGRAEDWRALSPYLAKAGNRVYMPDLIGYGRSAQPQDFSYSVRDESTIVLHFFDVLGLHQADLGGWSMGGWIVQLFAAQHPERIKRLMIFDSAGLYALPNWNTNLFTPSNVDQLNQLDALLMPRPSHIPAFVAADILRLSRKNGWVIKRAMAQMLTGHDTADALLPQLKMPVTIEWGAEDHVTPINLGETMHSLIPQSQFNVYAGCGHLAPLQCSTAMGPNVVRFLQQPQAP